MARAEYQEAVDAGTTGFLAEQTRVDILQLSVGHLPPGAGCTVVLSYMFEAPLDAGRTRVTLPTTISPKYVPFGDNTPEAKKIASIHHALKTPAKLEFSLEACMGTRIHLVTSPSHEVTTVGGEEPGEGGLYRSTTRFDGTTADMDRDIVVLVECEDPARSVVLVEEAEGTRVVMVSLVPRLQPTTQPKLDIVFLIDCSGSMGGSSIALAREAINILLHSLPPSAYFNIVRFGSTYNKVFRESRRYNNDSLKEAKKAMKTLAANLGGTEILSPLQHLLEEKTTAPRRIFVLTDGSVSNSSACIKVTRANNTRNAVFTLGIGAGADRHLVRGLARAGRGTAEFTVEGEIMAPKVIGQLKQCLQPSYQDVRVDWGPGVGPETSAQTPSHPPPLYDGTRIQIFRLFEVGRSQPEEITVSATIPSTGGTFTETVKADSEVLKDKLLHKMFARKLIQELEENYEEKEEGEVKALVIEVALRYQLLSRYTSFVAVDTKKGMQVAGGLVKQHIPNQYPHGFGGVGAPQMMMCMGAAPLRQKMCSAPMAGGAPKGFSANRIMHRARNMMKSAPPPPMMFGGEVIFVAEGAVGECAKDLVQEQEEQELKEQDPEKRRMEITLRLIGLQTAEGSFEECEAVYGWCQLEEQKQQLQQLHQQGEEQLQLFFTLLVLVLLEERFQGTRGCWDLVAEKGWTWVRQRSTPNNLQDHIRQIIKQ